MWKLHSQYIIFYTIFDEKIYIRNNAQLLLDFVWNILHQLLGITDANDRSIVLFTDINLATLRIGKTAYPFQIFVTSRFFPFYVLAFCHHAFTSIYLAFPRSAFTILSLFVFVKKLSVPQVSSNKTLSLIQCACPEYVLRWP